MLVLNNALVKVSSGIPDIICIAQITLKVVNNALLSNNRRFDFGWLENVFQFLGHEHWLEGGANLVTQVTHLPLHSISGFFILERKADLVEKI